MIEVQFTSINLYLTPLGLGKNLSKYTSVCYPENERKRFASLTDFEGLHFLRAKVLAIYT